MQGSRPYATTDRYPMEALNAHMVTSMLSSVFTIAV